MSQFVFCCWLFIDMYVSCSGSITSFGEERANLIAIVHL